MWLSYLVTQILNPIFRLLLITSLIQIATSNASEKASLSRKKHADSEATYLWEVGRKAYETKDYEIATKSLTKLISRFPGSPHTHQAQLWLGTSFLALKKPQDAQPVLQAYIESLSPHPSTYAARVLLARAYTLSGKHQEALLTVLEILEAPATVIIPNLVRLEALLVKAHAHRALGHQMDRAKRALDAFWASQERKSGPAGSALTVSPPSEWIAEAHYLELQLEASTCENLKALPKMEEGRVRAVLENRGICLLQSMGRFQRILKLGDTRSIEPALHTLHQAFADYRLACTHPPAPAPSPKRSSIELERYQRELRDILIQDCRKKTKQALSMLDGVNTQIPEKQLVPWKKLKEELQFQTASSQGGN